VIAGNLNATGLSLSGNVVSGISTTANITGANIIATAAMSAGSISVSGNASSGTAAADTNTTQLATTAFVIGQASAVTPTSIGTNTTGTSLRYARADHTHTGVSSLANGGGITASASTGAVTLGSTATSANTAGAIVARGASGEFSAGVITATATNARYADLAEYYAADAEYSPGTVLSFGGSQEVTIATGINDVRVAGVVSTNPAYAMNTAIETAHSVALALTGRVPTLVVGPVAKGDMMVTAGGGRAKACATPVMGTVIGKAVQDHPGGSGTIEIVVGRL
jgi:hypothetical protein